MMETERFWYVWVKNGQPPSFKHKTLESAKEEAERLVRLNSKTHAQVFELVGVCRRIDIEWSEIVAGDIPF